MTIWSELLGVSVRRTAETRIIEFGTGAPLILLHGQGGHAENFRHNILAYGEKFHVIAADMRWHGLSDKWGTPDELIAELAAGVLRLLDEESIDTFFMEGQSLGGWVAARIALDNPERLRGLVLTTPMGLGAARIVDPIMMGEWLEAQHRALGNVTPDAIRGRMSSLFADAANLDDEIVEVRSRIYSDPDTNEALRKVAAAYFNPQKAGEQAIGDDLLAQIAVPTLVYWGSHNDPFPIEVGKAIANAIPGAQFHCANAGHWAQYERPEEHNKVVLDFLASI